MDSPRLLWTYGCKHGERSPPLTIETFRDLLELCHIFSDYNACSLCQYNPFSILQYSFLQHSVSSGCSFFPSPSLSQFEGNCVRNRTLKVSYPNIEDFTFIADWQLGQIIQCWKKHQQQTCTGESGFVLKCCHQNLNTLAASI